MASELKIPKVIWCLWLQGWDKAPAVVSACLSSWLAHNVDWSVHALDEQSLVRFLPHESLERAAAARAHPEAFSDYVRLELLHRYGGVWADATTVCMTPLDEWLPSRMSEGFFAFERPAADRMIASWFLAAEKGSYIIDQWRRSVIDYWLQNSEREDYFWLHRLFAQRYDKDPSFRSAWDATAKLPAAHEGHFHPYDARLTRSANAYQIEMLANPPSPVFKLTHKISDSPAPDSLASRLCDRWRSAAPARQPTRRRILAAWYGSFPGHGTIGDLRSLESAVSHLVGRGHRVSHATAFDLDIPGARRVDWCTMDPHEFDVTAFVCGPILSFHPETNRFFQHFRPHRLVGVAVSILPKEHPHHANPFNALFAREGTDEAFGDLAIVAPAPYEPAKRRNQKTIGVALRGPQTDYGRDRCKWKTVEETATALAQSIRAQTYGHVIEIENHLLRSAKTPDQIEDQYASCDLVITSRFHGAIAAMRHCVPFIAIDQIQGGAKVQNLLGGLKWPHVYRVDQLGNVDLANVANELLSDTHRATLLETRNRAVTAANTTLSELDRWIASLP